MQIKSAITKIVLVVVSLMHIVYGEIRPLARVSRVLIWGAIASPMLWAPGGKEPKPQAPAVFAGGPAVFAGECLSVSSTLM